MRYFTFGILLFYLRSTLALGSTGCNPIYCFSILNSLFPVTESSCMKLTDLIECISHCFPMSSDDVNNGLKSLRLEICSDSYIENTQAINNCISNHEYSVFSCIYHYLKSEAQDADLDPKVVKCWKKYNSNVCNTRMASCTHHESEIFNSLLEKFISDIYADSCDYLITYNAISNIKLATTHEDYIELAQCFNGKSHLVDKCMPKKWTTANLSMETVSQEDLCRSIDYVLDCLGGIVEINCSNLKRKFAGIVQLLHTNVISNCSENNEIIVIPSHYRKNASKVNGKVPENAAITGQATMKNTKPFSPSNSFEVSNDYSTEKISDIQLNSHREPKFKVSDGDTGSKLSEKISSLPIIPTNTSIVSTNSTNPIIIEKHVFITVAYRSKNAGNAIYISLEFIVMLFVIQIWVSRL